jgi:SAM-dependent methyltransferase
MSTVERFSERAGAYNHYRWDYAPETIDALIAECGLKSPSTIADVGAGTGMLARLFAKRGHSVIAIEPGAEMRAVAARQLPASVRIIDALSDDTTLPGRSVDMITVGRALHWFPAASSRTEFRRILKSDGWLAIFRIPCTKAELVKAVKDVRVAENGWEMAHEKTRNQSAPLPFFFGHDHLRTLSYPAVVRETWDDFLGRICSFAPAPGANHPLRPRLEDALREVFDRFRDGDTLTVPIATEVTSGHMAESFTESGA